MFVDFRIYSTRRFFRFLIAVLVVVSASCDPNDNDDLDLRPLTEDEVYLAEAYADIKLARRHYPSNPALAESLFTVLDSTIDTVRIANTIRSINKEPEQWTAIFEEIEQKLRQSGAERNSEPDRSEKPR